MKVVREIICKCLSLEEAMIEQAKHISVRGDGKGLGKGLGKARLSSHDELLNVRNTKLKENQNNDIAPIWKCQYKSKEQLIIEQNSNVILHDWCESHKLLINSIKLLWESFI